MSDRKFDDVAAHFSRNVYWASKSTIRLRCALEECALLRKSNLFVLDTRGGLRLRGQIFANQDISCSVPSFEKSWIATGVYERSGDRWD